MRICLASGLRIRLAAAREQKTRPNSTQREQPNQMHIHNGNYDISIFECKKLGKLVIAFTE